MKKIYVCIALIIGFIAWKADFVFFTETERKLCTLQVSDVIPPGTFGSQAGLEYKLQGFLTSPLYRQCLSSDEIKSRFEQRMLKKRAELQQETTSNVLAELPSINEGLMAPVHNIGLAKFTEFDWSAAKGFFELGSMWEPDRHADARNFMGNYPNLKFTFKSCSFWPSNVTEDEPDPPEFTCDVGMNDTIFLQGNRFQDTFTRYFLGRTLLSSENDVKLFMEPRLANSRETRFLELHVLGLSISKETVLKNWPRKEDSAENAVRTISVPMFKFSEQAQFSLW